MRLKTSLWECCSASGPAACLMGRGGLIKCSVSRCGRSMAISSPPQLQLLLVVQHRVCWCVCVLSCVCVWGCVCMGVCVGVWMCVWGCGGVCVCVWTCECLYVCCMQM